MAEDIVIHLADYRTSGVRVISGRDRGQEVRKAVGLDSIDERLAADLKLRVLIRIPEDVVFVASSFYLGMFGPSIRRFGEAEFRARFQFEGPVSQSVISDAIQEAIKRGTQEAVKRGSPLPSSS